MDVIIERSAEVKNEWIPNSTSLYVHTACTGITFTVLLCFYFCLSTIWYRQTELTQQQFTSLLESLLPLYIYTGLFISPSGTSELDCATTKKDRAERSISIGRESLKAFLY